MEGWGGKADFFLFFEIVTFETVHSLSQVNIKELFLSFWSTEDFSISDELNVNCLSNNQIEKMEKA